MTFPRTNYLARIAMTSLLAGVLVHAPVAMADETICDGVISGDTLGNVVVPSGAFCTLMDVEVDGNIKADGAVDVEIVGGTIDGNVNIKHSTGMVDINGANIDGNLSITKSTLVSIIVENSQVGGNVSIKKNGADIIFVRNDNAIDGNLSVVDNETVIGFLIGSCVSGGNTVNGNVTMSKNTAGGRMSLNCSEIAGNIDVSDNTVIGDFFDLDRDVQVTGNTVGGNVTVNNNTARDEIAIGDALATPGQPELFINIVGGNLSCMGNDPDPTTEADPGEGQPVENGNVVNGKIDCSD